MLSRFALQLEKPLVRRGLVLVGVVGTLYLAPMVLFGAYMGIAALFFPGVTERLMYFPVGALGIGGAVGIAAAWCRVLASNRKLQTSKAFFVFGRGPRNRCRYRGGVWQSWSIWRRGSGWIVQSAGLEFCGCRNHGRGTVGRYHWCSRIAIRQHR